MCPKAGQDMIDRISFDTYSAFAEGLGRYLDDLFGLHVYAESTGTIKDKTRFCDEGVSYMSANRVWKLPGVMKGICEKIMQHVAESNAN